MTKDEYRTFVRDQRAAGREHVRQLCWDLRRHLFGKFPDPIDKENIARIQARVGDMNAAVKRATAAMGPLKISLDSFDHDLAQWRANQRAELMVHPIIDPTRVALITSPA